MSNAISSLLHFIRETGGVREWITFDLDVLRWIEAQPMAIADKTQVETAAVGASIAPPGKVPMSQAKWRFRVCCDADCGKMVCLVDVARVDACHRCEGMYFRQLRAGMFEAVTA